MGTALIQFKIMPESPDVDLESAKTKITEAVTEKGGEVTKIEEQPIAFGLKALITFIRLDESKSQDDVESALKDVDGISSIDIIDYRRAVE